MSKFLHCPLFLGIRDSVQDPAHKQHFKHLGCALFDKSCSISWTFLISSREIISSQANEEVSSLTKESSQLGMFFSSTSLFIFTLSVLSTLPFKHKVKQSFTTPNPKPLNQLFHWTRTFPTWAKLIEHKREYVMLKQNKTARFRAISPPPSKRINSSARNMCVSWMVR